MLSPTQKLLRLQNDRSETSKSLALVKREVKLMENKPEVKRYNEYTQLKGSGEIQQYIHASNKMIKLKASLVNIDKLINDHMVKYKLQCMDATTSTIAASVNHHYMLQCMDATTSTIAASVTPEKYNGNNKELSGNPKSLTNEFNLDNDNEDDEEIFRVKMKSSDALPIVHADGNVKCQNEPNTESTAVTATTKNIDIAVSNGSSSKSVVESKRSLSNDMLPEKESSTNKKIKDY